MSKKEAYKTMQLLMPNKRYDLFIDLDDIDIDDPDSYKYMFLEHNKNQTLKELCLQENLLYLGFVEYSFYHHQGNRKMYPVAGFVTQN
jgi:hypothetical protein